MKHPNIEEVVWKDAGVLLAEKFRPGLPVKRTIGYVIYEDDDELALATEIHPNVADFMQEEMDHTKIPKVLIVSRRIIRKGGPKRERVRKAPMVKEEVQEVTSG